MNEGQRMKSKRIELGMTVDELAQKVGLARATLYRYESGYTDHIKMKHIPKLAEALETTPEYILGVEIENAPSEDEAREIDFIFDSLTPTNQAKLLELARLYAYQQKLSALQSKTEETE